MFLSLDGVFNAKEDFKKFNIAFAPPTVISPVYYCQNGPATALTATPSVVGATLNWYTCRGGAASAGAPTPSTTTVGTTSYYVSETVGGVESTRSKIDVIVVADNGALFLILDVMLHKLQILKSAAPAT